MSDPDGIYINDPAFFALPDKVRRALLHGQITPREARMLRNSAYIGWAAGETFWQEAMRQRCG